METDAPPRAIDLGVSAVVDLSGFAGFASDQTIAIRGLVDLMAAVDLGRIAGWRGATVVAQYYTFAGQNGSGILGDIQGFSNIDADRFARAGEISLDVNWPGERLRTRVGRLDANADFALPVSTDVFQNASAGYSAAIFPMPTYPNPQLGVVAAYQVAPVLAITGGVYWGPSVHDMPDEMVSDGRMWMVQGTLGEDARSGRVAAGVWRHTGQFVQAGNDRPVRPTGWFALAERALGRWSSGRSIVVSVQAARSTSGVAPVHQHFATGVRLEHLSSRRPGDIMGLRVSFARLDQQAIAGAAYERAWEFFHRFALHGALSLQPDLQVIRLPGEIDQPNRTVFSLRLNVEF